VALRGRRPEDVPILHAQLYDDVLTRSRADSRPWRPLADDASPYASIDAADAAFFSVVAAEDGALAGEALLWGIDDHNRLAHLGLALLPAFRGRGWSTDVLRALCRYGFEIRGLNRLQLETSANNEAMIRAAAKAGFTEEGRLRSAAWVAGAFEDTVIFGLLAPDRATAFTGF
jgi:RimJ/RimL family protein N-acetyltransferase